MIPGSNQSSRCNLSQKRCTGDCANSSRGFFARIMFNPWLMTGWKTYSRISTSALEIQQIILTACPSTKSTWISAVAPGVKSVMTLCLLGFRMLSRWSSKSTFRVTQTHGQASGTEKVCILLLKLLIISLKFILSFYLQSTSTLSLSLHFKKWIFLS